MLRIRKSTTLGLLGLALICGAWTSPASAAEFVLKNECIDSIRVALRYKDSASGRWSTKGWYLISPGQAITPSSGGKKLRTGNAVYYFFASTVDGKSTWAGSAKNLADRTYTVRGREFRFRERRDAYGHRNLRLTCEERLPSVTSPPVLPCIQGQDSCCAELFGPKWKWRGHGLFDGCNGGPPI